MFNKRRTEKKSHIDLQLGGSILLGGAGIGLIVMAATGAIAPLGLAIAVGVAASVAVVLSAWFVFRIFEDFFKPEPLENTFKLT